MCMLLNETSRFHDAVGLFSNRSQKTSKCGKNTNFGVICGLLLNRRTATWNLSLIQSMSLFNNNIDSNKSPFPVTISMYISVIFMVDTYRPQLSTSVQSCLEALLVCVYKNGQQTNQYGIGWFGLSVFKEGQRQMGLLATTIFSATHAVLKCWK